MKSELPKTAIGIDVETTSLDPTQGEIIDVAAIRYDLESNQEVGRFESLTRPSQSLTAQIIALTGISQDMVETAPPFADVRSDLAQFIGDQEIIFAHNASFDLNFLAAHGLPLSNPVWDTFVLSAVAWPEAESYNLGMLAKQLGIEREGEHRAIADILASWHLLAHIRRRLSLPPTFYKQVEETLQKSKQNHYLGLFSRSTGTVTPPAGRAKNTASKILSASAVSKLSTSQAIFGKKSTVAKQLSLDSDHRAKQLEMAQIVEDLINEKKIGIIEVETGILRSLGYLVPTLLYLAQHARQRIVISTYTQSLRDQLIKQDIPRLQQLLGLNIPAATFKDRRSYLCHRRLQRLLTHPTASPEDAWTLIKVLIWLAQGGDGDLERMNTSHQASRLLRLLHADSLTCRINCGDDDQLCFYQQARQRANRARLLVGSHALALEADAKNPALRAAALIIEEAHDLEKAARVSADIDFTSQRIAELMAPFVQLAAQQTDSQKTEHLTGEAKQLRDGYIELLFQGSAVIRAHGTDDQLYLSQIVRRSATWQQFARQADTWRSQLHFIIGLARSLSTDLSDKNQRILQQAIHMAEAFGIEFEHFLQGNSERAQWIELKENRTAYLRDTTISVEAPLQVLLSIASSTIYISDALTINGSFRFIKDKLGIKDAEEYHIDSAHNYKNQLLIYVVDDGPDPSQDTFDQNTALLIRKLCAKVPGHILALFTSHRAIKSVHNLLVRPLNKANIKLLAQSLSGGRKNIAEQFRQNKRAVLLGADSFWASSLTPSATGVGTTPERHGTANSTDDTEPLIVVIPRLPFPATSAPIMRAVAELQPEKSSFESTVLPEMIVRLRQGVSQMIRSKYEKGAVVILDPRLTRRQYGRRVLESLPPATVQIGPSSKLIPHLKGWLGESRRGKK